MNLSGLDLNLLIVLDALLDERNVTRAGQRVCLSQPAASAALCRLRQFFGDELLVLHHRQMALTPVARELVEPVRDLLLRVNSIVTRSRVFDPSTAVRRFRISASDYSAAVLMPQALAAAQKQAPGLTFEIVDIAPIPGELIERDMVDVVIVPMEWLPAEHPSELLFEDRLVCLVWSGNSAVKANLTRRQFLDAGHVAVRFAGRPQPVHEEWFIGELGKKRRIDVEVPTFHLVPQLVVGTTRVATVPERLARQYARSLPLRVMASPVRTPKLSEGIQWNRHLDPDPGLKWLRNLLRQSASLNR